MDEDATWYGSIDLRANHIVLDGFPALRERGTTPPPLLGPCLLWPRSPISATADLLSKMDLWCGWLDHPARAFGGLYHCAKFGLNRCSSFNNIQVLVFCDFGLKTPIHTPFGSFLGHIPPKMSLIVLTPERTVLGRNHVIWATEHEYWPCGWSWAREEEKKDRTGQEKSHKMVIFHLFGEKPPLKRSASKMCSR